ncbi:MAG: hypothetical protein KAI45_02105 [Melioribacteraceae bacterium]|nr:hypothetical protein [Melioribacteraceae bacterium]
MKHSILSKWGLAFLILYLVLCWFAENISCGPWFEGCWDIYVLGITIPAMFLVDFLSPWPIGNHELRVLAIITTSLMIYFLVLFIERFIQRKRNV